MILIEKYTGWWEDECQVHFVRRSHLDGDVGLGSSQLCGFWLPQIVSRREKDFRCCEVDWKESTFRAERAAGGERSRCFQQLYEYFFGVELSGGVLAASFPSPTWFCSTLLCNMLLSCIEREKREHMLIISLNLWKKEHCTALIKLSFAAHACVSLSFTINYDRLKCIFSTTHEKLFAFASINIIKFIFVIWKIWDWIKFFY